MPADYKLRLGDGTILAVDEAGLRTWLIDGRAMVQPAGSRRWIPPKEGLAQVQAETPRLESLPRPPLTPPPPPPGPTSPPAPRTPPPPTPAPPPPRAPRRPPARAPPPTGGPPPAPAKRAAPAAPLDLAEVARTAFVAKAPTDDTAPAQTAPPPPDALPVIPFKPLDTEALRERAKATVHQEPDEEEALEELPLVDPAEDPLMRATRKGQDLLAAAAARVR